jgi:hypothetical protein
MYAPARAADEMARLVLPIIEELRSEGTHSLRAVAHRLNECGIRTPRGSVWFASGVKRVIDRLARIGWAV